MDRIRLFSTPLAAAALLLVSFAGQAHAQSASDTVLDRLRATYASMEALRAEFTQTMGQASLQGTIVLSGDQYRIEMPGQVLVTDGETAWAYSSDDNQVLINHHQDDFSAFAPSTFFTTYPANFATEVAGTETIAGARHDVLRLTPRERGTPVREVTLYVRGSDSLPTQVRLIDANGSTMTFRLEGIQVNPPLAANTFRFSPPAGAEIIDLR